MTFAGTNKMHYLKPYNNSNIKKMKMYWNGANLAHPIAGLIPISADR